MSTTFRQQMEAARAAQRDAQRTVKAAGKTTQTSDNAPEAGMPGPSATKQSIWDLMGQEAAKMFPTETDPVKRRSAFLASARGHVLYRAYKTASAARLVPDGASATSKSADSHSLIGDCIVEETTRLAKSDGLSYPDADRAFRKSVRGHLLHAAYRETKTR